MFLSAESFLAVLICRLGLGSSMPTGVEVPGCLLHRSMELFRAQRGQASLRASASRSLVSDITKAQ